MSENPVIPPAYCPNCGRIVAPDWEICPDCGVSIKTGEYITNVPTPVSHMVPIEPEPALRCKRCGRGLKPNWESCPDCGTIMDYVESNSTIQTDHDSPAQSAKPDLPVRSNTGWIIALGITSAVFLFLLIISLVKMGVNTTRQQQTDRLLRNLRQTATSSASEYMVNIEQLESTIAALESEKIDIENNFQATLIAQEDNFHTTLVEYYFQNAVNVYGPEAGDLLHEEDGYIKTNWANLDIENGIIAATFTNPYDSWQNDWDYGFMFRNTGSNLQYRIVVTSDSTWDLIFANDDDRPVIASGNLDNLNLGENEKNAIMVIFSNDYGSLSVNGEFVSTFDLSGKLESGNVCVATGFFDGNELEGYSTDYVDFMVWELP